jgi:hypothetical protein
MEPDLNRDYSALVFRLDVRAYVLTVQQRYSGLFYCSYDIFSVPYRLYLEYRRKDPK